MSDGVEFDCFEAALAHVFGLKDLAKSHPARDIGLAKTLLRDGLTVALIL
jgi:hypothetical protein